MLSQAVRKPVKQSFSSRARGSTANVLCCLLYVRYLVALGVALQKAALVVHWLLARTPPAHLLRTVRTLEVAVHLVEVRLCKAPRVPVPHEPV
jgi:Flp pilus assembly protein TadB